MINCEKCNKEYEEDGETQCAECRLAGKKAFLQSVDYFKYFPERESDY